MAPGRHSIQRLHDSAPAVNVRRAGGAHPDRRNLIAGDVWVPEALECDVVPIAAMHAGDAGIFVEPGALVESDGARLGFGLAGPGYDPAGVVAFDERFGPDTRRRNPDADDQQN